MGKSGKATKRKSPGEPPKPGRRWALPAAALAAALFPWLLYFQTIHAGFAWDDHNLILNQPQDPGLSDFARLWVSDFWMTDQVTNSSQYYRPLTTTTFALDSLIHGRDPGGFHLTNLIIYSGTCAVALLVFRRLMNDLPAALALALAFAAHPAHVENVAWVSGRTDLVCALFMFASLLFYLRAEEEEKPWQWALSLALFFLSLLGKEMSIVMVGVVAVHQYLRRGVNRSMFVRTGTYAAAGAVFWLVHSLAVSKTTAPENVYLTAAEKALSVARNFSLGSFYSVVPGGFELIVTATREEAARLFPLPTGPALAATLFLPAALAAAAVFALVKKDKLLALGLASGLGSIAPVSNVVPFGVIFAVRFLLIPSFFFLLAGGALLERARAYSFRLGQVEITPLIMVMALTTMVYSAVTLSWVPRWQNDVTLMEAALAKAPDASLAHFLLGNGLTEKGDRDGAVRHYERAIELRPGYREAMLNLAVVEGLRGRPARSEALYREILKMYPGDRGARSRLARLLANSGRMDEAVRLMGGGTGPR